MNTQHLTDELIRSAIARRVTAAAEGDLHERVLAATAANQQRRGWRVRLDGEWLLPQQGLAVRLSVALVLLATVALVAVLVGSQINRTTPAPLGGLAYLSQGDLYVAGPGGESPRLVWDIPATEDVAPRQLVWVDPETVLLQDYSSEGGVHVVDVATGAHRQLDTGQFVAVSLDGHQLATLRYEEGATPPERLRLIDIASGGLIAELAAPIRAYAHNWSPDGRWLLGEMPESIYKVDTTNRAITTLATGLCCGLSLHSPVWSPDGTRVVYVDYHLPVSAGDCEFRCGTLWAVPAAGGGAPVRLTTELGSEILPAFSPDGRWIAYIDESTNDLIVIAADGSGARVLAPDPRSRPGLDSVPNREFRWDPDSAGITYLTKVATLWHITLGGVATQLEGSAISEFARQVLP